MRPAARRRNERGVAMLIVIIAIAVLTVVGTEFAYNSRVDLQLAANHRDEIRAHYLAKSAIGFSRLMLRFQKQLDQTPIPDLGSMLGALSGAGAPAGAGVPQPQSMSLQLWRMAKIDCHLLKGLVRQETEEDLPRSSGTSSGFDDEYPKLAERQQARSFGGFEGCFSAQISDEEERLNLAKLDAPGLTSRALMMRAIELFNDKRFEFLFEREDQNRVKVSPNDTLIAIRDWIDEDEVQSTINLNPQGEPFLRGFSDEDMAYQSYTPRSQAKNARFDSLDELYRVHGVNDGFMAAFRDRVTVYPDINSRLNVNTDDPVLLYMAIRSVADPLRPDPRLDDPAFIDTVIQKIRAARVFAIFGMSVTDFVGIVESAGVAVNASIKSNVAQNRMVGDKSNTYRIQAVGEAGAVQKTITVVVRLDDRLGKLLYWREE
jgi:general secretion pathway protein K